MHGKIWLSEIRFGCYNLIEILDGENIVLKVKSIAPDAKHLISVDLSNGWQ